MSKFITATLLRGGSTIAQHLSVQIDNMSVQEAAYYGGAQPYHRYAGYVWSSTVFRQADLLKDENNTDPKTNTNVQYRIINDVEPFPDGHWEPILDRVIGT